MIKNNKRFWFASLSVAVFLLFILAALKDQNREWKKHQASQKKGTLEIKQVILNKLSRIDRCTTCHVDTEKTHPDSHLAKHKYERFGCTICHEGQGLATGKETAHGYVPHWDRPMHKGIYIQGSCGKCHEDTNKKGMEYLERGKRLFNEYGCIGCHSVDGWGGNISVDIGEIADKPKEEFDFNYVDGEKTVANWLFEHFKDPQKVTPARPDVDVPYASAMPNNNLSDEDAKALTALMLAYTAERKSIPYEYKVPAISRPPVVYASKVEAGRAVYDKFGCAGCHGKDGAKGVANYNAQGGKVPSLTYVKEGFTEEELKKKIRLGVQPVDKEDPKGSVPPLWMQKWGERITDEELDDLVEYLFSLMPEEEKWTE